MARPITWQDNSNALRGAAAVLEVFGRGGDRIANAIQGIGQVAVDNRNQQIEANTKEAVANILASQDPGAAAAAVPQGDWRFDPLAVANATQQRETQLDQKKLTDLSIKNTDLQMQQTQAQLDDRIAAREAEDIALQYRDAALSGKPVDIDRGDPRWKTAAGKLALDRIDGWTRDAADMQYKRDSLSLQKAAAARAARDDAERRALDRALGQVVEFSGSPEWAGKAPEERDRLIGDVFKKNGVSLSHLDLGQKAYDLGYSGNKATQGELERVDPTTGLSGKKLMELQTAEVAAAERGLNQWKAENANLIRVGQLDATNPYEKKDDVTAANMVLEAIPDVTTGWGPNWSTEDVIQRADGIQKWAKKNGTPITRAQAFMLVPKTKGQIGLGDTFRLVDDSIAKDIADFHDLVQKGGWEQVAADARTQEAQFEKKQAEAARANAAINAAVRQDGPLPNTLVTKYKNSPIVRRDQAERELAEIQLALANADNLTSEQLANLAARRKAANEALARLQ
jgi:hypothetical protein